MTDLHLSSFSVGKWIILGRCRLDLGCGFRLGLSSVSAGACGGFSSVCPRRPRSISPCLSGSVCVGFGVIDLGRGPVFGLGRLFPALAATAAPFPGGFYLCFVVAVLGVFLTRGAIVVAAFLGRLRLLDPNLGLRMFLA